MSGVGTKSDWSAGTVQVVTTNNTGLPVSYWAKLATQKIIDVGANTHPLIFEQAVAFEAAIEESIAHYMQLAVDSDKDTIRGKLNSQGHKDLADIIGRL